MEVADGRQAPSKRAGAATAAGLICQEATHPSGEAGNATNPRASHQHSNTRQSLPYAVSVDFALLARAKSAASSSVVASSAMAAGRARRTSASSIATTSQNDGYRGLRYRVPVIYRAHDIRQYEHTKLMTWSDRMAISPGMGRKKRWPERVGAKFATGTLDRIAAALADGEERTAFIREAVERELERREKAAAKTIPQKRR